MIKGLNDHVTFVVVAILLCKLKDKQKQMDLLCIIPEWGDNRFAFIYIVTFHM